MSNPLDFSDALKTMLAARTMLATVPVIVDKQQNLDAAIQSAVSKMGICILLYSAAGKRPAKSFPGDPFETAINIEIYAMPLLQKNTVVPAATALAEVILAVDGYSHPSDFSGNSYGKTVVLEWALVPDPEYLVYRVTAAQNLFF